MTEPYLILTGSGGPQEKHLKRTLRSRSMDIRPRSDSSDIATESVARIIDPGPSVHPPQPSARRRRRQLRRRRTFLSDDARLRAR